MKRLLFTLLILVMLQGCANFSENLADFNRGYNESNQAFNQGASATQGNSSTTAARPGSYVGLLYSEQVTGMTKQCYYNYLGSIHTRTIQSYELCPLEIQP